MAISLKPVSQQVIVITGASSGIGLATARAAAKAGAKLVLAARDESELKNLVDEINRDGGSAIFVAGDVGRRADVRRLKQAAIERFGGFDTWVNDAEVSIWGRLEEISDDGHRRLFDTNFWGVVYGSLEAVEHLKRQGGALINLGSVASDQAFPLQGMYSASKHAVKGFTDALRKELEHEDAPVSVTLIKPAGIDAPFTEHAKNDTKKQPNLPPPVYNPEEVARAILYAAAYPKRDIYVGSAARAMSLANRTAPRAMDKVGEKFLYGQQLRDGRPRDREGALHRPGHDGRVRGDYPGYVMDASVYSRVSRHPLVTGAVAAAVGAAAYALVQQRRDRRRERKRLLAD